MLVALVSLIFPAPAFSNEGQGSGAMCRDNEIIVAMQEGGDGPRIRTLSILNRSIQERPVADIPVRVESIDIGDVYGNGKNSIVAGLFQTYTGSPGAVRVYTYDEEIQTWEEEALGSDILNNVEAIEIGDANNDGVEDIVIGLEYNRDVSSSRIRLYSYMDGAWVTENVSDPSWQRHVQHIEVADVDSDGQNEIVALTSNSYFALQFPMVQVMIFKKTAGVWGATQIFEAGVINDQGFLDRFVLSERLAVADLNNDRDLEIIFGVSAGQTGWPGSLYVLDKMGEDWVPTTIADVSGLIDSIDVGDINENGRVDIMYSGGGNLNLLENNISGWEHHSLGSYAPVFIYDSGIGDQNNDGRLDAVSAIGSSLMQVVRMSGGEYEMSDLFTFDAMIDSAQIGDADNITIDDTPEIFTFLSLWFSRSQDADYNGDGVVSVSDIFAFLADWYARC